MALGAGRATSGRSAAPLAEVVPLIESARAAGLRYVRDDRPGIRRLRSGRGFRYVGPDGRAIRDAEVLARIRSLVIPPAWQKVWICPLEHGHLQATGFDARGRKQYRYHPRWRAVRDETKYHRVAAFARALPRLRKRVEEDLARPGLPREKVLAAVTRLLEATFLRIGNEEYVRANGSFGLTTLRNNHVEVARGTVRFRFRGKSGVHHQIELHDRRLAHIVRRCRDLPGHELFEYVDDDGQVGAIDSADVNGYLHEVAGEAFTAKDFRTWAGTLLAAACLRDCPDCCSKTAARRNVVAAIAEVASRLGNTVAVCRHCYVHPGIIAAYLDGSLASSLEGAATVAGLRAEEAAVLAFLERS